MNNNLKSSSVVTPLTKSFIMNIKVYDKKRNTTTHGQYFVDYTTDLVTYIQMEIGARDVKNLTITLNIIPACRKSYLQGKKAVVKQERDSLASLIKDFEINAIPGKTWYDDNLSFALYQRISLAEGFKKSHDPFVEILKDTSGNVLYPRERIAPDTVFAHGEQGLRNLIQVLNNIYQDLCNDYAQQQEQC